MDNEAVVRGLRRLRSARAASEAGEAADLWRQISQLAVPTLDYWDVVWVPSHTGDLEPAKAERRLRRARQQARWAEEWLQANEDADAAAERGLEGHALPAATVRRVRNIDEKVMIVLHHMAATVAREAGGG